MTDATKAELARYGELLSEIKSRIRAAQARAVQAVLFELELQGAVLRHGAGMISLAPPTSASSNVAR